MKKMLLAAALVTALLSISAVAQNAKISKSAIGPTPGLAPTAVGNCTPTCLFYTGDWDPSASNWVAFGNGDEYDGGTVYNYTNYVPFVVPTGATWTVTALFTNNIFLNYSTFTNHFKLDPKEASWSINTGVSTGSGGTVIAGGILSPASLTSTGREYSSEYFEYSVSVKTGGISLPAGSYWLAVAGECTDASCTEFMYNTDTTSRTNHFGPVAPKCEAYQNGPAAGLDYVNDCTQGYAMSGEAFMSAGVIGRR